MYKRTEHRTPNYIPDRCSSKVKNTDVNTPTGQTRRNPFESWLDIDYLTKDLALDHMPCLSLINIVDYGVYSS